MTDKFDPYHQWLGIRSEDQPPDHYQLLGLRRFEDNPETIQHAADRQTAHLRSLQTKEYAPLVKKLLADVSAAKVCLLTPEKKSAYDTTLQGNTEDTAFDFASTEWLPAKPRSRPKKEQPQNQKRQYVIIGCLCAVTLLVAVVIWYAKSTPGTASTGIAAKPVLTPVISVPPPKQVSTPQPQEKHEAPPIAIAPVQVATNTVASASVPDNAVKVEPPKVEPPKAAVTPTPPATPPPAKEPAGKKPPVAAAPEKPLEKLPVPALAVQMEIGQQINDVYKIDGIKSAAEKAKCAKQLLNQAEASQKPEERFVIRRRAAELAGDAGQPSLVRQAVESIAAEFSIDGLMVEAKMFDRQPVTDGADELIRRAVAEDRFDVAMSVINRMFQKASTKERKEIRRRQVEVERLQERWRDATVAQKTLETDIDNPVANLTVGRWLWFQKGDVQQGLAYCAKGDDILLQRLCQQELTEHPTQSDGQLKLADAWWELTRTRKSEEKDFFMLHAAEWYEEVNPTLPGGLTKVRVEKRLDEAAALKRSLAKLVIPPPIGSRCKPGGSLPTGRWADLLTLVDVKRDGAGGSWERSGSAMLTKQPVKNALLSLPITVEGDYDLEIQFTRNTGQEAVAIEFLVGPNPCLLTLSESAGKTSRLVINSSLSPPQQGNRIGIEPSVLTNGQKYAVLVTVRLKGEDATVQVSLDGKPHLNWTGKQKAAFVEGWPVKPFAIGTHESVTFHSARLRPISGKATVIVSK